MRFGISLVVIFFVLDGHMATVVDPELTRLNALPGIPEVAETMSFLKRNWIEFNVNESGSAQQVVMIENLQKAPSKGSCTRDILRLIFNLNEKWALEFVDSFGKPESGLLTGKFTWTGNYEECVSAVAPPSKFSFGFKGQYCWVNIKPKLTGMPANMAMKIGACIPDSCDSQRIMKHYYDLVNFLDKIPYVDRLLDNGTLTAISCVPDHVDWTTASIACLFFCLLVAAVVLVASLVDLLGSRQSSSADKRDAKTEESGSTTQNGGPTTHDNGPVITNGSIQNVDLQIDRSGNEPGGPTTTDDTRVLIAPEDQDQSRKAFLQKAMDVLQCFSAVKNGSAIMDITKKPGQLDCIHGIRFLSITWVIMGHTFLFGIGSVGNPAKIIDIMDMWHFQAVIQALFSVDTFFFLGGFLLAYLFLKENAAPKTAGAWLYFYAHRYIRLTPVYAIVIAFWSSTWNYLGSGPFWPYDSPQSTICRNNWWKNLFYVNNFSSLTDMCMGWSWYLSNDMQFFIISPLFLLTLKRWPIAGYILSSVTILASWIITFFVSYGNDMPVLLEGDVRSIALTDTNDPTVKLFDLIYERPYCRISPYIVGILVAYVFLKTRNNKRAAHKCWVVLGWTSATVMGLTLIYGLYHSHLSIVGSAFFNSLSRTAWSLCLAWIVFACLAGYGGPVNWVLSLRYFFPLSRLTYSAYLIHPFIMYWYYYSLKDTFYLSLTYLVFVYLAFLLLAFGLAFVVSLLFESPIVGLEKQLRKLLK